MKKLLLLLIIPLLFSCNDKKVKKLEEKINNMELEMQSNSWIGTFEGTCPSYNMRKKDGEVFLIYGEPVTMDPSTRRYVIYENNTCSIIFEDYACHNIKYDVTHSNNDFKLTMQPEIGSACGGAPIILIKEGDSFSIYGDKYTALGRPGFKVDKIK